MGDRSLRIDRDQLGEIYARRNMYIDEARLGEGDVLLRRVLTACEEEVESVERLATKLSKFSDPCVVRLGPNGWLCSAMVDDAFDAQLRPMALIRDEEDCQLVLERPGGKTLHEELGREELHWRKRGLRLAEQVAHALRFIHSVGIVHRNLHPRNIFTDPELSVAKLADSEVSECVARAISAGALTRDISPIFIAPELIDGEDSGEPQDAFSFGILLQSILLGRLPSPTRQEPGLALPGDCPHQLASVVWECCSFDPGGRPPMAELVHRIRQCCSALCFPSWERNGANPMPSWGDGRELQEIRSSEIDLGELLGEGSVGEVLRAHWRGCAVAVKRTKGENDQEGIAHLQSELARLPPTLHPNIVKVYGSVRAGNRFGLVMELMEGGSVKSNFDHPLLRWQRRGVPLLTHIARALEFLHERMVPPVVHRDIKPANVLVDATLSTARLADIGAAKVMSGTSMRTTIGTDFFLAPEIIDGSPYGKSVDVFSFGVLLNVLIRGGECEYASRQQAPEGVPEPVKELVTACVRSEPDERIEMQELAAKLERVSADHCHAVGALDEELPDRFLCPIGHHVMVDPVIIPSGNIFDKANILRWWECKGALEDPLTRQVVSRRELIPVMLLRREIHEWYATRGLPYPPQ